MRACWLLLEPGVEHIESTYTSFYTDLYFSASVAFQSLVNAFTIFLWLWQQQNWENILQDDSLYYAVFISLSNVNQANPGCSLWIKQKNK